MYEVFLQLQLRLFWVIVSSETTVHFIKTKRPSLKRLENVINNNEHFYISRVDENKC